mgnify:CR=1 FL=1|jgi:regulator of cell morphogenesis and NO signaling
MNTTAPLTDLAVRDIAIGRPGATAIFRRFKIDYCCGGGATLAAAAEERGVNIEALVEAIETLAPRSNTVPVDTGALIDHLLERYHEVHRRQFPEAISLAARVESVHGDNPDCPLGLTQHLAFMFDDLETHHQKEEMGLFPMIRCGETHVDGPISCMTAEHEDVLEQLKGLARLTHDFTPPDGACGTWRALYALCQEIDSDLRDHMHLENNDLFRRFG